MSTSLLASGSADTNIIIWDWTTGVLIRTLISHTNRVLWSIDLYNTDTLISGSEDGTIKLWRISDGALLQTKSTGNTIRSLTMLNTSK